MRATSLVLSLLLLSGCASQPADSGLLITAQTALLGAAQTPTNDVGLYVRQGVIADVGPLAAMRSAHPRARLLDAGEATILPGLTDAHAHLYGLGLALETVNLTGTQSIEEIRSRLRERAATMPPGEWILGRGWDQNDWEVKQFPTAADLDALGERPVWLTRVDGHAGWANRAALRAAGITAASTDPQGGRIERLPSGEPSGVFIDEAMELVSRVIPAATFEQHKRRVQASAQRIAEQGLTEIHDAGTTAETLRAVRELIAERRFPIRLYAMLSDNESLLREWFARGRVIDEGGRLTVRALKMYADGALGSRGAALLEPYSDDPANSGLLISSAEHIAGVARRAKAAGFQVGTHAIGDRGVRTVIDAYNAAGITAADRARIEHLQVIAPADVPRLVRAGIISSFQPVHATSDMYWAGDRLGPQRVLGAYAWRTVLRAGGRVAFGSDFPVEEVNPWHGIYAAVTRQDQKQWPAGGWYPSERVTLAEAIRGFTLDAAYAAFEEQSRGTIEKGKLADFTIVEGDVFAMPPADLHKVRVLKTIVGGEVVYSAP